MARRRGIVGITNIMGMGGMRATMGMVGIGGITMESREVAAAEGGTNTANIVEAVGLAVGADGMGMDAMRCSRVESCRRPICSLF